MLAAVLVLLLAGFPVAFTLMGTAVAFGLLGHLVGAFDLHLFLALALRLVDLMDNDLLQAIPLFVYLGVILQRTTLASDLLQTMGELFGSRAGGLGISTILVGAVLAPTTGVVGATVLTIGLLALPSMLAAGYDRRLASGIVCCAGTLGTVIPPSIILIMLSGVMRDAQHMAGSITLNFKQLYLGMLVPVACLFCAYLAYVVVVSRASPRACPALPLRRPSFRRVVVALIAPLLLIVLMLASILTGWLYTVEAAAYGALGATLYALLRGELTFARLAETVHQVTRLVAVVFTLLIGAGTFSLVFRGLGGTDTVIRLLAEVPAGRDGAVLVVLGLSLGFCMFLDALEILFLVVPTTMPALLALGGDPVWLAVLFAITVQTGFLIPPSGFAICFLRSVAPAEVRTADIYRGVLPIVAIQIVVLSLLWAYPPSATWLATRIAAETASR